MSAAEPQHYIEAVTGRLILDSHLTWTPEFEVRLGDGSCGRGSAPRGETVSIYEGPTVAAGPEAFADAAGTLAGGSFTQTSFDAAATALGRRWGGRVTLALSIAFYLAARTASPSVTGGHRRPWLLLNVLNGGLHAYTNPVTSDVPEFMLRTRSDDLARVADAYVALNGVIRGHLRGLPTVEVGGNRVHSLGDSPNEACLAFLRRVLREEGLESMFGIALDASAGDWVTSDGYRLPVSGREFARGELARWWLEIVNEFGVELLEDPFSERDSDGWRALYATRPSTCLLVGDNYTSTDIQQLIGGAKAEHLDGVLVKPNQNGTISGTLGFAAAGRAAGLALVASHRSVETESTFLVDITDDMQADSLKIGPLPDFTAVIKYNELLRRVVA